MRVADPGVVGEDVAQHDLRLRGEEVRLGRRRAPACRRRGVGAVPGLRREARVAERAPLRYVQGVVLIELVGPIGGVVVDVARVARSRQRRSDRVLLRLTGGVGGDRRYARVAQCLGHVRVLDPRVLAGDDGAGRVVGQAVGRSEGLVEADLGINGVVSCGRRGRQPTSGGGRAVDARVGGGGETGPGVRGLTGGRAGVGEAVRRR